MDFNSINADACGHTKTNLIQTKYVWAIDHFSCRPEETGVYLKSPVFTLDLPDKKVELIIRVYPKGDRKSCEEYVSVFVEVMTKDISINAKYELGLINRHGNKKKLYTTASRIWKEDTNTWGFNKFVLRSNIYDPKSDFYISSDRLIVYCEFSVAVDNVNILYANLNGNATAKTSSVVRHDDFLKELFETPKLMDFTLLINGKTVEFHKVVLASKSPFFEALLTGEINKMQIDDISYEAMIQLRRYMYTGEVENIDNISQELLLASIKYEMESLKVICRENILSKMTVENAVKLLMFADRNDLQELKDAVSVFFKQHARAIKEATNSFTMLDKEHLPLALSVLADAL